MNAILRRPKKNWRIDRSVRYRSAFARFVRRPRASDRRRHRNHADPNEVGQLPPGTERDNEADSEGDAMNWIISAAIAAYVILVVNDILTDALDDVNRGGPR
jgi:hypothetical protein